jgi:cytochrome c551/c552
MPAAPGGRAASPPDGAEKAPRERRACSACHDPEVDVQNTQLRSTAKDYG